LLGRIPDAPSRLGHASFAIDVGRSVERIEEAEARLSSSARGHPLPLGADSRRQPLRPDVVVEIVAVRELLVRRELPEPEGCGNGSSAAAIRARVRETCTPVELGYPRSAERIGLSHKSRRDETGGFSSDPPAHATTRAPSERQDRAEGDAVWTGASRGVI
jgi:hypothetical protein